MIVRRFACSDVTNFANVEFYSFKFARTVKIFLQHVRGTVASVDSKEIRRF